MQRLRIEELVLSLPRNPGTSLGQTSIVAKLRSREPREDLDEKNLSGVGRLDVGQLGNNAGDLCGRDDASDVDLANSRVADVSTHASRVTS